MNPNVRGCAPDTPRESFEAPYGSFSVGAPAPTAPVTGLLVSVLMGIAACGPGADVKPVVPVTPPPKTTFEDGPVAKFHSIRFAMVIPFVDGKAWKIDDHATRELVATHEGSHSELHVALWPEQDLMNRAKCELRATELGYMPDLELDVIDQEVASIPAGWDTRVLVASEVPKGRAGVIGHVFAFASSIRKCIFFHFRSEVAGSAGSGSGGGTASEATILSDRLATVRLKMLEDITLDAFAVVPREKPP